MSGPRKEEVRAAITRPAKPIAPQKRRTKPCGGGCGREIEARTRGASGKCRTCYKAALAESRQQMPVDCPRCGERMDRRYTECHRPACVAARTTGDAPIPGDPVTVASRRLSDRIMALYTRIAGERGCTLRDAAVALNSGPARPSRRIVEHYPMPSRVHSFTLGGVSGGMLG